MNKDYLFDKTGEDAEIQKLENLLQSFRPEKTIAPKIPAENVVPFRKPRKTFRYAFAIAASLLITFTLGFFVLNTGKKDLQDVSLSKNNAPETINQAQKSNNQARESVNEARKTINEGRTTINQAQETINEGRESVNQSRKSVNEGRESNNQAQKTINDGQKGVNQAPKTINEARKIVFTAQNIGKYAQNKQKSIKKVPQIINETLTEEEKFAYEQLKLALSITGTNLKTVKEKIDNKETETSALNNKIVTK
jgi:membrane-associated HD superfamily phosphohydrolase